MNKISIENIFNWIKTDENQALKYLIASLLILHYAIIMTLTEPIVQKDAGIVFDEPFVSILKDIIGNLTLAMGLWLVFLFIKKACSFKEAFLIVGFSTLPAVITTLYYCFLVLLGNDLSSYSESLGTVSMIAFIVTLVMIMSFVRLKVNDITLKAIGITITSILVSNILNSIVAIFFVII